MKVKTKIYSAAHPNRIADMLENRKKVFGDLLPSLVASYGSLQGKPKVQMFEGIKGVQQAYTTAFELMEHHGEEGLWIGNIGFLSEAYPEVMKEYEKIIATAKKSTIREINFGGEKSKQWINSINQKEDRHHQGLYIEDNSSSGLTDQLIIGNKVIFFSIDKELFTVIVEGEQIAKSQRFMFNSIWQAYYKPKK